MLAAFALALLPAVAVAAPPKLSAQSAILMEASTGEVLYARNADERRPIASTTKLMTALLTMEKAKLADRMTASDYVAAPIESKLSLRPGERLSVADLLRGLMLESANDAAMTLADGVGGSEAGFVRMMNRKARRLKLTNTHYENPIGLDEAGNFSSAHDLARLAALLRRESFIRKVANRTSATLTTGYRPRTIRNRNSLLGRDPKVNGLKTGHTSGAGYVLVGTRSNDGVTLVSAVLGTPSLAARDADSLALLKWGAGKMERIRPVTEGEVVGTPEIAFRRGATANLVTSGSVERIVRSGAKITWDDVGVPATVTRPGRARAEVRLSRGVRGRGADRGRADRRPALRAGGRRGPAHEGLVHAPAGADPRGARAGRYGPHGTPPAPGPAAPPPLRARSRMILTVTLNTAIDKTLAVPNFRLGRRHRTVEQTTMPGGKGVNVARVLKTLGAPVIATGLAGGATGTRIVEQLTGFAVLSDFVRIREESRTNTAVIDPTTGEQTEINERGPAVSAQEIELFVDKLLYLARGASMCVFAGSLPRDVDADVYAGLIRELKRLGVVCIVDTDGDPLRRAVRAEPDVISPNVLEAEELVGHEFNEAEDHTIAVQEMCELGAREAIMTAPDGCYAQMCPPVPGEPHPLYRVRVRSGAIEPRATVGSGDAFLAGFVNARYNGLGTEECLVAGVACGAQSTLQLGAGLIDPAQVERLVGEVEVTRLALDAEVPSQAPWS